MIDSVHVRDFTHNQLAISDLILADDIHLKTSIPNINRSQVSILPNFKHIFKPGQDLYLYYEIYNLSLDRTGSSNYNVSYEIRKLREKKSGLAKIFKMFKKDQPHQTIVATSYNYQGNRKRENNYRILQLTDYQPGNYELHVKVKDDNKIATQEQYISFSIKSDK